MCVLRTVYMKAILDILNYICLNSKVKSAFLKIDYRVLPIHVLRKKLKSLLDLCSLKDIKRAYEKNIFNNINSLRVVVEVITKNKCRDSELVFEILRGYEQMSDEDRMNQQLISACKEAEKKETWRNLLNATDELNEELIAACKEVENLNSEQTDLPHAEEIPDNIAVSKPTCSKSVHDIPSTSTGITELDSLFSRSKTPYICIVSSDSEDEEVAVEKKEEEEDTDNDLHLKSNNLFSMIQDETKIHSTTEYLDYLQIIREYNFNEF